MCPPETLFQHFSKVRNLKNMQMSVTWHGWSLQHRVAWDEGSRNEALLLWPISKWGERDLLCSLSFSLLIREIFSFSVEKSELHTKNIIISNHCSPTLKDSSLQFRSKQATNSYPFHTNGKYCKYLLKKAQGIFSIAALFCSFLDCMIPSS